MKRLIAVLLIVLLLGACGSPGEPTPKAAEEETITVTDNLGREVAVPIAPKRVAALIGSFADIWVLAGGIDSLTAAANDTWTSFDLPLGDDVINLGGAKDISLETLIASEPDLILASCNTAVDMELLPTFEGLDYSVLYFQVENFADYLRMLDVCTQITGQTENYTRYGVEVQKQVDAALTMQDGSAPSVLYIRATGSSYKVKGSRGNVLGEMLAALGCRNIADSDDTLLEDLNMEAIMAADPDYIFFVCQSADAETAEKQLKETLLSNPVWSMIRAIAEGRYFIMEHRLYNLKPNDQWGAAYERLAEILYSPRNEA